MAQPTMSKNYKKKKKWKKSNVLVTISQKSQRELNCVSSANVELIRYSKTNNKEHQEKSGQNWVKIGILLFSPQQHVWLCLPQEAVATVIIVTIFLYRE